MLRELRITGKLVHADGVARRVEVRYYNMHERLARVDRELQTTGSSAMRCQHDLGISSFEALLQAHGLVGLFIYFLAEAFLIFTTVDEHPRAARRFYVVVQRTSTFEAEALGDDPGLPSSNLGRARAVGASYGEEEEEEGAHAVASVVSAAVPSSS